MCGITGLVDFRRRADTDDTGLIEAMTDTLHRRGPDERGVWRHGHAALGVRRLSVIDLAGGKQPMVDERPDREPVAIAYTGEVFNCPELRAELGARGHRFETTSDTEVVLRAYLEWGAGCAERLLGMFAFAVWDARTEELLLIRDRLGIYPLYYAEIDGGVVFGSEPKGILAHPQIRPEIDQSGLRAIVTLVKSSDHGIFKGMFEVDPGSIVRFGRGGLAKSRFWSLQAVEHTDDLDTTVRTVRDLLEDSVRRQMVSDVPLGVFLSGGLDSSALAALAIRTGGSDEKLRTFSVNFTGHADAFKPDEVRATPDFPFVKIMSEFLGTRHTAVELSADQLMDAEARSTVLTARDHPTSLGDLDTSLYLLCKAFREQCTVSLTGDGADELFGGYHWFHEERFRGEGTMPWLEFARRMAGKNQMRSSGLLAPDLADVLEADEYERAEYEKAVAGVPVLEGESDIDRELRRITYLNMTGYLRIILDRRDRMGMAAALEGRVPFCDHRLVEYVFNVPWEMKTFDGREKSLLRAAVRDLLPPSVLYRKKAGYPPTDDPRYGALLNARLAEVVADPKAPVRDLLDLGTAKSFVEDPTGPAAEVVNRFSIEMVLGLNEWLGRYDVGLAL
ncbi:asparagine synthase (glutamine-hydrolyzing) [Actinomadura atramentaria]|uniref:asparagine synthase (glutamine-hydrolyzing) n=1 Tax=Actinomadura atramentaria TaxID=1990 RepID=UPI000371EF1F|nr:asparagine synthase (glutamine-hydrolyzing) [Actinomadura atramentaria]